MCEWQFGFLKFSNLQKFWALLFISSIILCTNCQTQPASSRKFDSFPPNTLWAWERSENLEFLDTKQFGVAFLAQTINLAADKVLINPRRQPLKVSPDTKIIAVTRIETSKRTENRATLSELQQSEIVLNILKTIELKNVSAIQIDFDATVSEREFYRKILNEIRQKLPNDYPLSITSLASFCIDDNWIKDLPVDEIVPMIFRLGADEKTVKNYLANGNDFKTPVCQTSYGIAVDEPVKVNFPSKRRIYFFNVRAWNQKDVETLTK
jgi:hypothetical protein